MIDLSTWLPKPETARLLNMSERSLDRLVASGKGPECRNRPRPGKRPEPVYNPSDVEALVAAMNAKPAVIAADSPLGPAPVTSALVPARAVRGGELPSQLAVAFHVVEQLAIIAQRGASGPAGVSNPLWLTIEQAACYTGLSERFLRRLVRSGQLAAIRDRAWKIRRVDLDNLASSASVAELAGLGGKQ